MSELEEFVRRIIQGLDSVGIPYMVVGSLASSAHGDPRGTNDMDVVIAVNSDRITELVSEFQRDLYADLKCAQEALQHKTLFNVIDFSKGLKADLIPLNESAFEQSKFARREIAQVSGSMAWTASPEDTILSKLNWSKMGDSERQYRDAVGVAALKKATIDVGYMQKWAVQLGVEELFKKLLDEVGLSNRPLQ
jgi:hypothetical protein